MSGFAGLEFGQVQTLNIEAVKSQPAKPVTLEPQTLKPCTTEPETSRRHYRFCANDIAL